MASGPSLLRAGRRHRTACEVENEHLEEPAFAYLASLQKAPHYPCGELGGGLLLWPFFEAPSGP